MAIAYQYALVIPDLSLEGEFEYKIPDFLVGKISLGSLAYVPFGRRSIYAYVIRLIENPSYDKEKLKTIINVSSHLSLGEKFVHLAFWMSTYYCASLPSVFKLIIPSSLRKHKYKKKIQKVYFFNFEKFKNEGVEKFKRKKILSKLIVDLSHTLTPKEKNTREQIKKKILCSDASFRNLVHSSWLIENEEQVQRFILEETKLLKSKIQINKEQEKALKLIEEQIIKKKKNILLHGVTGSGKTEVYLRAIEKCLKRKQQVIVLVPEISLAYQTIENLQKHFDDKLAILHSGLNQEEKAEQWLMIKNEKTPIIIGARSAIFAPVEHLGLIVIDEEQEGAYKQKNAIRYNARDIALFRAKQENALVLLCSATPSFESYYRAKQGYYYLLELKERVANQSMPEIEIVDMRKEAEKEGRVQIFSQFLLVEIKKALKNNLQVIIFINRRGYSPKVQCSSCGHILECPSCDKSLIYHKFDDELSCNICDYRIKAPKSCPSCNKDTLDLIGIGIEKVFKSLQVLFPRAKIERLDSDIGRRKNLQKN